MTTWKELKEFCNSLDEKHLERFIVVISEDGENSYFASFTKAEENYYLSDDGETSIPESEITGSTEGLTIAWPKGDPYLFEIFPED